MINRGVCTAANGLYMLANVFVNLWLLQVSYTVQHTVTTKQVLVWLAVWAMKISLWLDPIMNISLLPNKTIIAGSSATDKKLSDFAMENNIGGLEFLACIPGTIGGGLRINSGCFGTEFKDILLSVQAIPKAVAGPHGPELMYPSLWTRA